MDGLPITLIVKAPNQQIEDQTIKCKETWTIHELKGHLSEVYPCKPRKEEQKLIYSGQLLTDSVVLKDILRRYEGQDTHTVHLVCSSLQSRHRSNISQANKMANSSVTQQVNSGGAEDSRNSLDGSSTNSFNELRRRNVPDTSTTPTDTNGINSNSAHINYWQNQVNPSPNDMWRSMVHPWMAYYNPVTPMMMSVPLAPVGNDNSDYAAAQRAMMHQMQVQYMQYYMQMMQNTGNVAMANYQQFFMNQQLQQNIPNQQNDQTAGNAQQNQNVVNNLNNAQGVINELENWDFLEYFYFLSRFAIMFAIIYFYSSPARFLLVLVTGFFIYLYQIRFFHTLLQNNEVENNNNNEPANNNNNIAAENQQAQPQNAENIVPAPVADAGDRNTENSQERNNSDAETAGNDTNTLQVINNQPSRLAITWTIITSFLTSLLPDTPNAI